MAVKHGIALVPSVPSVEWIMRQNKPHAIPYVLLLVVLYLHELVAEVVVVEELVIVVSQNEMLLPLQVLQQPNRGSGIIAGDVTQNENMVCVLHYGIPVVGHAIVIVLWPVQFIM